MAGTLYTRPLSRSFTQQRTLRRPSTQTFRGQEEFEVFRCRWPLFDLRIALRTLTLQQLGWSDWRLTRVQFVTDEAVATAAAEESQTRQKKQTSDGMLLWLPLQAHQVIGSSPSSRCSRIA